MNAVRPSLLPDGSSRGHCGPDRLRTRPSGGLCERGPLGAGEPAHHGGLSHLFRERARPAAHRGDRAPGRARNIWTGRPAGSAVTRGRGLASHALVDGTGCCPEPGAARSRGSTRTRNIPSQSRRVEYRGPRRAGQRRPQPQFQCADGLADPARPGNGVGQAFWPPSIGQRVDAALHCRTGRPSGGLSEGHFRTAPCLDLRAAIHAGRRLPASGDHPALAVAWRTFAAQF